MTEGGTQQLSRETCAKVTFNHHPLLLPFPSLSHPYRPTPTCPTLFVDLWEKLLRRFVPRPLPSSFLPQRAFPNLVLPKRRRSSPSFSFLLFLVRSFDDDLQFADGGYYIKSLLDTTAREILNAEFKKQAELESAKAEEKKVEVKEEDVKVVVSSPTPSLLRSSSSKDTVDNYKKKHSLTLLCFISLFLRPSLPPRPLRVSSSFSEPAFEPAGRWTSSTSPTLNRNGSSGRREEI